MVPFETRRQSDGAGRAADESAVLPGPVMLATVAYALTYLMWERGGWGGPAIRDLIGNVAFMPLNLAVVVLNLLASRNSKLDQGVRLALRFVAAGSAMVLIGNGMSFYLAAQGQHPPISWADLFYLADSLLIFAALLSFPLTRRIRLERWKLVLDGAMVLVGGSVWCGTSPCGRARRRTAIRWS